MRAKLPAMGAEKGVGPSAAGAEALALMRAAERATLATSLARAGIEGWPYASLVLVATAADGSPLLLLSDLADHSKNIAQESRVSLLFDGTLGLAEPLTGARLSLLGRVQETREERHMARFLRRHPSAAAYAKFKDFRLYRVAAEVGHLVAGFGRIHWLAAEEVLAGAAAPALAAAEDEILAHMNQDHKEALRLIAETLLGLKAGDWTMSGIDPQGLDLRADGSLARIVFDAPVRDAGEARAALVALARSARAAALASPRPR